MAFPNGKYIFLPFYYHFLTISRRRRLLFSRMRLSAYETSCIEDLYGGENDGKAGMLRLL